MKLIKVWVSILLLFSLLLPAFFHVDAARVAVIKEVQGEVYIKKGNGSREFKAKDGMSLSEGDSVRTVKKSSANIVYDDGSKTTVAPSSKLSISKLKDKNNGKQTKVKVVSGKVWNSVKSLSNANDEYDVETPTAVMGVRGTHFLVTTDPITGEASVSVLDGMVGVSQNSDNGSSSSGTSSSTGQVGQSEQLVGFNQSLVTQSTQQPISEAKPIDVKQLVQQVEPEVIVEMIQDLTETIRETNQQAIENQQMFELSEQQEMLEKAIELSKTAANLASIQETVLNEINQAVIKSEVEQLLRSRFNQTLDNVVNENNQLKTETQTTQQQVTNAAKEAGMTDEQIEDIGPPPVPESPTETTQPATNTGGGGGGGTDDPVPLPPTPTIFGFADGNDFYINIQGHEFSSTLKLYDANDNSLVETIDKASELERFIVTLDGKSYYVTQTVDGKESNPSNIIVSIGDPSEIWINNLPEMAPGNNNFVFDIEVKDQNGNYIRNLSPSDFVFNVTDQEENQLGYLNIVKIEEKYFGDSQYNNHYYQITANFNLLGSFIVIPNVQDISFYDQMINIEFVESATISGTVSLPPGLIGLSEPLEVSITADSSSSATIILQPNTTSAIYELAIPANIDIMYINYELPSYNGFELFSYGYIELTNIINLSPSNTQAVDITLEKVPEINNLISEPMNDSITLNWDEYQGDYGIPANGYHIFLNDILLTGNHITDNTYIRDTTYTITNLAPNNNYNIRIVAVNELGIAATSILNVSTSELPIIPNTRFNYVSSSSFDLSWDSYIEATNYNVYLNDTPHEVTTSDTIRFSDLDLYETYVVRVEAVDSSDDTIAGSTISIKTLDDEFDLFEHYDSGPDYIGLKWNFKSYSWGYNYIIQYGRDGILDKELLVYVDESDCDADGSTVHYVEELDPSTEYTFLITAYYNDEPDVLEPIGAATVILSTSN
ncbi:fibronectin type III domain-containing protein [Calidifontibacillus oryziterrae]|uniref:fibronectin type III domain-containing protein n=1 Tax=Calidifontibacillus oryziterrae TaxID=1191699 RepID=UPI0002FA86B8|nr:FecR domain-containing protein [Calidifontibacillus oryziterrae]